MLYPGNSALMCKVSLVMQFLIGHMLVVHIDVSLKANPGITLVMDVRV